MSHWIWNKHSIIFKNCLALSYLTFHTKFVSKEIVMTCWQNAVQQWKFIASRNMSYLQAISKSTSANASWSIHNKHRNTVWLYCRGFLRHSLAISYAKLQYINYVFRKKNDLTCKLLTYVYSQLFDTQTYVGIFWRPIRYLHILQTGLLECLYILKY